MTAIAALELGRRVVCIEQNADYARVIQDRCHDLFNGPEDAQVILGDSRNMEPLVTDSVGLVVTARLTGTKPITGKAQRTRRRAGLHSFLRRN